MMDRITLFGCCSLIILWFMSSELGAQSLVEVEGAGQFSPLDTVSSPFNVVVKSDGTIAIRRYKIGDFVQGGVVFFVDESGEHGLVCSKEDQATGIRWHAGQNFRTRAMADGIFAGAQNTPVIVAGQLNFDDGDPYAAYICMILEISESGVNYGDWYLPAFDELNLMYQHRNVITSVSQANGGGVFTAASYWSSTEDGEDPAGLALRKDWNGSQGASGKSSTLGVRAIRRF